MDAFECSICSDLFLEPVTAPCGHSFCRRCLARCLDHKSECPLCRNIMLGVPVGVTVALTSLMAIHVPTELLAARAARAETAGAASHPGDGNTTPMPMFVMQAVLPEPKCGMGLFIFEPRYRLLVRRAMEGSRRFGMMAGGRSTDRATEVTIVDCSTTPDGRFHIGIVPTGKVVRCVSRSMDDSGYVVGHVEDVHDVPDDEAVRVNLDRWRVDTHRVVRARGLCESHPTWPYPTTRKHLEHLPEFLPNQRQWVYACDLHIDVLVKELHACVLEVIEHHTVVANAMRDHYGPSVPLREIVRRLELFQDIAAPDDTTKFSWSLCDAVSRMSREGERDDPMWENGYNNARDVELWHDFVVQSVNSNSVRERLMLCAAPINHLRGAAERWIGTQKLSPCGVFGRVDNFDTEDVESDVDVDDDEDRDDDDDDDDDEDDEEVEPEVEVDDEDEDEDDDDGDDDAM